jgi:hypothetical protein
MFRGDWIWQSNVNKKGEQFFWLWGRYSIFMHFQLVALLEK